MLRRAVRLLRPVSGSSSLLATSAEPAKPARERKPQSVTESVSPARGTERRPQSVPERIRPQSVPERIRPQSVPERIRPQSVPDRIRPQSVPESVKPSYLSAEIARMKKAYEDYNETPPKPFKIRKSDDLNLLLTRHFNKGAEDIQLKCSLAFDPRGGNPDELYAIDLEDEKAVEQKTIVNITMTITKGSHPEALEINVDCDRRGYLVNNIIFRENKKSKNDDDEFFPAFWRIGPELRTEIHNFLEKRGLDEIFACWVHDQMDDKAFKVRLRQLERINAFIDPKP